MKEPSAETAAPSEGGGCKPPAGPVCASHSPAARDDRDGPPPLRTKETPRAAGIIRVVPWMFSAPDSMSGAVFHYTT